MKALNELTADERFFYDHAGWGYKPGEETEEEGRIKGAIKLAEAEAWARANCCKSSWTVDHDADRSFLPKKDKRNLFCCEVAGPDGQSEVLCGIDLGKDENLHDPYTRVVEAELALEMMP